VIANTNGAEILSYIFEIDDGQAGPFIEL